MDLSVITKRLKNGWYENAASCISDFNLMIDNCLKYNPESSRVCKLAKSIKKHFDSLISKLPNEEHVVNRVTKSPPSPTVNKPMQVFSAMLDQKYRNITRSFMSPVDLDKYPDYLSIVNSPIDLSVIKNRLTNDMNDFIGDMKLLLSNSFVYNVPGSDNYEDARKLQNLFEHILSELGYQNYNSLNKFKHIGEMLSKMDKKVDSLTSLVLPGKRKKTYSVAGKQNLFNKLIKNLPKEEIDRMKARGILGGNINKMDDKNLIVVDKHVEDYMKENPKDIRQRPAKERARPLNSQPRAQELKKAKVSKPKAVKEVPLFEEDDDNMENLFKPVNLPPTKPISWPGMVISPSTVPQTTQQQKVKPRAPPKVMKVEKKETKVQNTPKLDPTALLDSLLTPTKVKEPEPPRIITLEMRREWDKQRKIDRETRNSYNERHGVRLMDQYDMFMLIEEELFDNNSR